MVDDSYHLVIPSGAAPDGPSAVRIPGYLLSRSAADSSLRWRPIVTHEGRSIASGGTYTGASQASGSFNRSRVWASISSSEYFRFRDLIIRRLN